MHTVTMKKKDDMTLVIHATKVRIRGISKGGVFKDRRRTPKVKQRANLRKELTS